MAGKTKFIGDVEVTGALSAASGVTGGSAKEIGFVLGAGVNLAVNDTVSVPRLVSSATAGTLQKLSGVVGTAPVGSALTVTLRIGGVTTATLTIAAGATTGSTTTFSTATLVENNLLTVLVTAIGSTTPGSNLHMIAVVV